MLKELTSSLLDEAQRDPSTPVFYMEQTGEIFTDYEYGTFSSSPDIFLTFLIDHTLLAFPSISSNNSNVKLLARVV